MVLHFLALHQGQAAGLCSLPHMCQLCVKIAFAKILSIYSKLLGGTKPGGVIHTGPCKEHQAARLKRKFQIITI